MRSLDGIARGDSDGLLALHDIQLRRPCPAISRGTFLPAPERTCEVSAGKLLPRRLEVFPLTKASELFGRKLQAWADERRIDVREAKVRRLLNAGKTLEASQLRSEIYKEMDRASRQLWDSIPGSSLERPPWKTLTPGPYTPSKSNRWKPR